MLFGASNEFFYYNYTKESTFDIALIVRLKEELNLEAFKASVAKTLRNYPELAYRLRLENNVLAAESNELPAAFYPESDRKYKYCSKDTNGYSFFFTYDKSGFTLHLYHGWTDFNGFYRFLRTVFWYYAEETGFVFSDDEKNELLPLMRTEAPDLSRADVEDLFDPYRKYQNINAVPAGTASQEPLFSIPYEPFEDEAGVTSTYTIELSTSAFLAETKKTKVSFVPLMVDIISSAVFKTFEPGDSPIGTMVPVDLRPLFGSDTCVNCSDGVCIRCCREDFLLSQTERCAKLKERMLSEKTKENFERVMAQKVEAVEIYKQDPRPLAQAVAERRKPRKPGTPGPFTVALSYPGKMSFTSGPDRMIADVFLEPLSRNPSIIAYTYGDSMRLFVMWRTDDSSFPEAILKEFRARGFDARFIDQGYRYMNSFDVEELSDD